MTLQILLNITMRYLLREDVILDLDIEKKLIDLVALIMTSSGATVIAANVGEITNTTWYMYVYITYYV